MIVYCIETIENCRRRRRLLFHTGQRGATKLQITFLSHPVYL